MSSVWRVQPEGTDLEDERIDKRAGNAETAVGGKRGTEGFEIAEQIGGRAVRRQGLCESLVPPAPYFQSRQRR